jgi:REP element-mobilizing transposase RayT
MITKRRDLSRSPSMVLGYHIILSAYGFWLPNDPRGSWSDTIRVYELLRFGPATKIQTTHSVAHAAHDRSLRLQAKQALRHKPVHFTGLQARAIARGFAIACREHAYALLALAILPDHAHLVMRAHPRPIDDIVKHLKAKATRQLTVESLHPFADDPRADETFPSPWARNHWSPFIDSPQYLRKAIDYVNDNPDRAALKRQHWSSVISPC